MRERILSLSKSLVCALALGAGLSSCVSSKAAPRPVDLPFSRIFVATYDEVWNATVAVLDNYSIISASRESGELKTEYTQAWFNSAVYEDPQKVDLLDEVHYKIEIRLSKGLVSQTGRSAVRVQVVKRLEKYGNLVTDWTRIPTDEIEEQVLLYRIGQKLRIQKAVARGRAKNKDKPGAEAAAPTE
ncbi:MAG: hypothetical protein ABIR96_05040 [Bdellovibrionota bacterium]